MIDQFDNLNQFVVRAGSRKPHVVCHKLLAVCIVEFIPMPMSLTHLICAITGVGEALRIETCFLRTESHRSTFVRNRFLIIEQTNHRMRTIFIKLARMGSLQVDDVTGKFNDRTLHPQTDSEQGNTPFPGKTDCLDLTFNTPFPKTARNQNTIVCCKKPLRPFRLDLFTLNRLNANLRAMRNPRVIERFVD